VGKYKEVFLLFFIVADGAKSENMYKSHNLNLVGVKHLIVNAVGI